MPAELLQPDGVRKENGRWLRNCPKCGEVVDHLRRNYCIHSHVNEQPCKRCSNINNNPSGMAGPVRVSWYNAFRKSAETRGLDWLISIQDIAQLFDAQHGKCALSGIPITWSSVNWKHSASIDRIDNTIGYVPGNIQLVHKKINMMRGTLSVQDFVDFCRQVAQQNTW